MSQENYKVISDLGEIEAKASQAPGLEGNTEVIIEVSADSVHSSKMVFKGTVFTKLRPPREPGRFLEGLGGLHGRLRDCPPRLSLSPVSAATRVQLRTFDFLGAFPDGELPRL